MDSANALDALQGGRVPSGDISLLQKSAEVETDASYRAEQPGMLNSIVGVVKDTAAKMMPGGLDIGQGGEDQTEISELRSANGTSGTGQDDAVDQPNSDGVAGREQPARREADSSQVSLGESSLEVS